MFIVDFECEKCKKGVMKYSGKARPGIHKKDALLLHHCTGCGSPLEFKNKRYPETELVKKNGI
jgi:hypothetical protein